MIRVVLEEGSHRLLVRLQAQYARIEWICDVFDRMWMVGAQADHGRAF